ncbi:hypothetical protein T484DRAFT_2423459 [Baffinella frigidus]|nr:hypothetical protein T484DRAFT_2423459 [Cryptophyta sp. CCMP2293]
MFPGRNSLSTVRGSHLRASVSQDSPAPGHAPAGDSGLVNAGRRSARKGAMGNERRWKRRQGRAVGAVPRAGRHPEAHHSPGQEGAQAARRTGLRQGARAPRAPRRGAGRRPCEPPGERGHEAHGAARSPRAWNLSLLRSIWRRHERKRVARAHGAEAAS